jgi:outer membrane murein-binding lipoprotein Lpp
MITTRRRRTSLAVGAGAVAAALVLSGCEAQQQADRRPSGREYANKMCQLSSDDTVIAVAIYGFIAQAEPRAGRFVYVPGTDSSPPPAGTQALQDKGPTYMYSTDPAQQAVVDGQLNAVGFYPTLLVAYHGLVRTDRLHPVVKLSGRYVSGPPRGQSIGVRAIAPQCDSTGAWRVTAPAGSAGAG